MFSPTVNSATTASVCRSAGTSGISSWADFETSTQSGEIAGRRISPLRVVVGLAREHVRQLERAGSRQARDAEDLPGARLEVDPAQPLAVDPASLDRHGLVDLVDHAGPEVGVDVVADHLAGQGPRVEGVDVVGADPATATQDGDPVGDREDLVHPVRDVEDAHAPAAHLGDHLEEPLDLLVRQHGRRLVEDQHATALPALECGRDRHDGPLHRGRGGQRAVDVEVDVERREHPTGLDLLLLPEDPAAEAASEAAVEREVVLGAQLEDQAEVLVDEAQPVGHGPAHLEGDTVQLGVGVRVCRVVRREHLDERRLARAVLAHQGVDLARRDVDRDVVQRPRPGEGLREVPDLKHRARRGIGVGIRTGSGADAGAGFDLGSLRHELDLPLPCGAN